MNIINRVIIKLNKLNISHLEKLYIENKDHIDSLNDEELKKVSNSFLYRTILNNIFSDVLKKGYILSNEYYSIKANFKVMKIIDLYLNQNNIKIVNKEYLLSKNLLDISLSNKKNKKLSLKYNDNE